MSARIIDFGQIRSKRRAKDKRYTPVAVDPTRLAPFIMPLTWRERWTIAKPWANDIAKLIALSPIVYALLFLTPR